MNINNRSDYHGDWHHGDWHEHGSGHWNDYPSAWGWGAGFVTGAAIASPWIWGYSGYSNPYWSEPDTSVTYIDYSQPIVVAAAPAYSTQAAPAVASAVAPAAAPPLPPAASPPTAQDQAMALFDEARGSFMNGDYKAALASVNKGIQKLPNDALLHEFRALCQFALGQYKPAAATLYAVLSVGPGWDWTTLSGLYPDVDVYSTQLRALETYVAENPNAAEGHFILAYHYLTSGHSAVAAREYKKLVQLNPKDDLAKQLLASLTGEQPAPSEPATPPKPVDPADITGNWKAIRPDGASIALTLTKDNTYTWKYTAGGKSQDFAGTYALNDNVLVLSQNDLPMMAGEINLLAANQMNFKLARSAVADPGLTFSK